ncbi:hypothetical protein [Streptomyces sp. VRA16 Mangrove soil]|nr:hypothetical protein [Streptomyces sp. VRA16 Mangrove soil]
MDTPWDAEWWPAAAVRVVATAAGEWADEVEQVEEGDRADDG